MAQTVPPPKINGDSFIVRCFVEQQNEKNKPSKMKKMKKEYAQKLAIQLHLIQVWLLS